MGDLKDKNEFAFSGFTSPFKASANYGWTGDGKQNVKLHYVD